MRNLFLSFAFIVSSVLTLAASPAPVRAQDQVLRATLKNGMRVIIVPNNLAPVVTTEINYLVGSNEAPPGFPGMAHAQEHMMFRGSPGLSAAQLSTITAAMGGRFDADTQQTVTQYFFTVPADDLEVALHIEAIRMRGILDTEALWDKERGAIEQEVAQDFSDPTYVFYSQLLSEMFTGTPYAHDALGTRPSFQKTTGAMLKKFHETWYAPNNAVLVIVGDVEPKTALEQVKRLFESVPSRPLPPRPPVRLQPLTPSTMEFGTDLPYGLSVVAYRFPGYDSPDYAAGQILADVLDSRRGNLYALGPQGKALSAGFSANSLPQAGLAYATAAFPKGGDGTALVGTLKEIIAGYLKNGVPAGLVEAAKRREVADAEFQKNSVAGLADAWSQAVAVEGRNSPEDDIAAIQRVTVADVNRVARRYLVNDSAIVAVLTPRASGKPVASSGFGGKESFAPSRTKPVTVPQWARRALVAAGIPKSTVNPTVTMLPNGLRLIVQPETISPTVSLFGQVKNNSDLQSPKGQEGVSSVLEDLFSYGTTTLDRLAFQKALDDIAATASAGTSFSLQVLSKNFDRGVQLLADNMLHPALPEPAFRVVRKETESTVAGQLQSPSHLLRHALRAALFPKGDPSLRQATPRTVASLTLADVRTYYGRVFRPDMTTIVVIGQVTPRQARSVVEKYFGGWRAEGPKPQTDDPAVPNNRSAATVVPDASRVQDQVTLAQTVGITRFSPDYYPLQVGNHVLSGGFYASRLYRDLREQTGLVYDVESFLNAGRTRTVFGVFYACDPPNVSRARALVERDLRQMQTQLVTPEELQQAKTLLLRRIPLSEASTDAVAGKLLGLAVEGLPLDEPLRAARRYREITAEQVRSVFARWIRPQDFVQATLGPQPQ